MLRTNFTAENTSLTRTHIQAFMDEGKKANKPKTPNDLKTELKAKGNSDESIDKILGDWDSYL